MSKAFDTVDRKKLFTILEEILLPEELFLFSILTRKPNIKVKVNDTFSELFQTLLGILQGDCMIAILFILYLACCLSNERNLIDAPSTPSTRTPTEETNETIIPTTKHILLNPKYADDITYITNNKKCKLLGSLLDTISDINRRKILTIDAMKKLNNILSITIKLRIQQDKSRTMESYH